MSLFKKAVDETQISAPPKDTRHHNSVKLFDLLPSEPFRTSHFEMRYPVHTYFDHILEKKGGNFS